MSENRATFHDKVGYPPKVLYQLGAMYLIFTVFGVIATGQGDIFVISGIPFPVPKNVSLIMNYMGNVIYVCMCLFLGPLVEKGKSKILLSSGLIICGLSFFGLYFIRSVFQVVLAQFLIRSGFSLLDVTGNLWATMPLRKYKATMMNWLHLFWGLGYIIGPWMSRYVRSTWPNQWFYVLTSILVLISVLSAAFAYIKNWEYTRPEISIVEIEKTGKEMQPPSLRLFDYFKDPMVWLFGLTLGCVIAAESCSWTYSLSYLLDVLHLSEEQFTQFYVHFNIVFTVSRGVSGLLIDFVGRVQCMVYYPAILAIIALVGILMKENGLGWLVASGFFLGPLFPTLITVGMDYFQERMTMAACVVLAIAHVVNLAVGELCNRLIPVPSFVFYGIVPVCLLIVISQGFVWSKMKPNKNQGLYERDVIKDVLSF